jgi:hypothetical protein
MQDVLIIVSWWWKSSRIFLSKRFTYGLERIISHIFLIFLNLWIFVILSSISEGYLLYLVH